MLTIHNKKRTKIAKSNKVLLNTNQILCKSGYPTHLPPSHNIQFLSSLMYYPYTSIPVINVNNVWHKGYVAPMTVFQMVPSQRHHELTNAARSVDPCE